MESQMSNEAHQFILSLIAEEAAEVSQAAVKCQRFGSSHAEKKGGVTNVQKLTGEQIDLRIMFNLYERVTGIALEAPGYDVQRKFQRIDRYIKISHQQGMISRECRDLFLQALAGEYLQIEANGLDV
jgi:hypothetical protein